MYFVFDGKRYQSYRELRRYCSKNSDEAVEIGKAIAVPNKNPPRKINIVKGCDLLKRTKFDPDT